MIEFNVPPFVGTEIEYVEDAMRRHKISGDGVYTKRCSEWMEERFQIPKVLLTTSGSSALEMAALLCNIKPGDEVIMPSFTFTSTANAFVLRGAQIVFVDIRPDTMNLDEKKLEDAITPRTKVIVPVHYAGVSCEMDTILEIAKRHNLYVVEDAAQGVMSTYKGKALGTIGDIGCFSFHETKNYSMGEGGAILLKEREKIETAEIFREKGTNRNKFFRGQVDKYTWVNYGSSYLPSEINAAYLWGELEAADQINENRRATWKHYQEGLKELAERGYIEQPYIPAECEHNAHMYYLKTTDLKERTALIEFLKKKEIQTVFHYVPLHSSEAGKKFGRFHGEDQYTTKESERLLRLPLYYGMKEEDCQRVIESVMEFYCGSIPKRKKKLAVIGANDFQNRLILKAKELGYETHVFAWKCGDVGEKSADYFYPISITEKEQILAKCKEVHIDGVASIASDLATITVNYIAEQMGLVGNSMECTCKATNKYQMRMAFRDAGIDTPQFVEAASVGEFYEKAKDMHFPVIVKPTDRSGSRSITKVEQDSQIERAIQSAVEVSFEGKAIIEEYLCGQEYSMEGITYQGKHEFLTVTKKATTGEPGFIETGHMEPAGLSREMEDKVKSTLSKALDALGVKNSATHSEFRITPEGRVAIIEIGARMGGDCIGSDLVYLSTGYDYVRMVIDVAMGHKPIWKRSKEPEYAVIRFIMGQQDLEELERIKREEPQLIFYISSMEEPGSHKIVDSASRLGYYILVGEDGERLCQIFEENL